MVSKTSILENLRRLDTLYHQNSASVKKSLFFSKLAILELCGWTEESMDDIIACCANRKLKERNNQDQIKKRIENTYGFVYEKHFRRMLVELIGLINTERLEGKIDSIKFQNFKSTLGSLKGTRDIEAHTHIKGATRSIAAPSKTIGNFRNIYDGLKEFETKLKRLIK
jgi:hypothetical protein